MTRSPVLQIYFHMHCKKTHINKFKLGSFCRYNLESDTYLKSKCTFLIQGLIYHSLCSLHQFHDPIFYYLVTFFFQLMNRSIEKCQAHLSTANNDKKNLSCLIAKFNCCCLFGVVDAYKNCLKFPMRLFRTIFL